MRHSGSPGSPGSPGSRAGHLLLLCLACGGALADLKICSFNIKSFGPNKAANPTVMNRIVKIIARCDITLVMEVRDCKECTLPQLEDLLKKYRNKNEFSFIASKRLGRTRYKEQYAFFYRRNLVKVNGTYQYREEDTHKPPVFLREPFAVRFDSPNTAVKELILLGQHTSPNSAVPEMQKLFSVYEKVAANWKNQNVILLGDFNAACTYASAADLARLEIRGPSFYWAIGDEVDTTVSRNTRCAYDRIVLHGDELRRALVAGSAKAFNFQEALKLTDEEAKQVSDHWPVEIKLKGAVHHHEL